MSRSPLGGSDEPLVWQANGHVPAPVEHRGPDTTLYFEEYGVRYLIDPSNPEAFLAYEGVMTEVVL